MNKFTQIKRYSVRNKEKIDNGQGRWNSTIMEIIYTHPDNTIEVLGEYKRNYPSHGKETFAPFISNEKHYALYSSHYTATRIMELPSCKDIGGEEVSGSGFCPAELWVPYEQVFVNTAGTKTKNGAGEEVIRYSTMSFIDDGEADENFGLEEMPKGFADYEFLCERSANFGLVAGCHWGDDSSWKLERFDLEEAHLGKIKREAPWGYLELTRNYTALRKHVSLERGIYIGNKAEDHRLNKEKMIEMALKDNFYFMNVETFKTIHLTGKNVKVFNNDEND